MSVAAMGAARCVSVLFQDEEEGDDDDVEALVVTRMRMWMRTSVTEGNTA